MGTANADQQYQWSGAKQYQATPYTGSTGYTPAHEDIGGVLAQINGQPSAAQAQLTAGTDEAVKRQLALAAAMRGGAAGNAASGQINAGGVQAQQEAANEAAQLRAQEEQRRAAMAAEIMQRGSEFNAAAQNQAGQFNTQNQEQMYQYQQSLAAQQQAQANQEMTALQGQAIDQNSASKWASIAGGAAGGAASGAGSIMAGIPKPPAAGRGAVAYKPMLRMIGERGPEAVVPLYDKAKLRAFADAVNKHLGGDNE